MVEYATEQVAAVGLPTCAEEALDGATNGQHAASPTPAREPTPLQPRSLLQAPRIEKWFDITEYEGYKVLIWVNYPKRLLEDIGKAQEANDPDEMERLMGQIVLQHNGWPHPETGEVLPQPQHHGFWDGLDNYLQQLIAVLVGPDRLATRESPKRSARR